MTHDNLLTILYVLLVWRNIHITADEQNYEKCLVMATPDMTACKISGIPRLPVSRCVGNVICNKTFRISVLPVEPLSTVFFPEILKQLINVCCGKCTTMYVVNNFMHPIDMNLSSVSSSHFVYPILARSAIKELYGFYYLPLIETPRTFLISKEVTAEELLARLIVSCCNMWPILVVCILMAAIAGYPIWLIETWQNKEEFPRPFLIGLFDGFWWSFVSMTTVGYGDKVPKFFIARLIAVIWILIGVIIVSILTAAMTTEITSETSSAPTTMAGLKIGVLKGRFYDASIVLRKGGYPDVSGNTSAIPGVLEMITKLRNGSISAFLVDKYTYTYCLVYFTNICLQGKCTDDALFFLNETHHTETVKGGESLSYGFLVKDIKDYKYFKQFVSDNEHNLQLCKELHMQEMPHDKRLNAHNIFSPKLGIFESAIWTSLAIFGVILSTGMVYEILRNQWYKKCSGKVTEMITTET